jgi:transcriptional regulator with XRE-family HTH domain
VLVVAKKKPKDTNPVAVAFGQLLREARERSGLSIQDAATASGMAYSAFARLERGEREPTISTLQRLATALGCEPSDLIPSKPE